MPLLHSATSAQALQEALDDQMLNLDLDESLVAGEEDEKLSDPTGQVVSREQAELI